jgi:predicted DsbA family dithiol-disulfide isomerase
MIASGVVARRVGPAFDQLVASGEGARQCHAIVAQADDRGVLGVPTFVLDETGELFWGTDRIWLLCERLNEMLRQSKRHDARAAHTSSFSGFPWPTIDRAG